MPNCSSRTWTALVGLLVALIPSVALVRCAGAVVVDEFPVPPATLPAGIVRGPDGNLWFTEFDGSRIGRITPGGVVTEFTLPANRGPLGVTVGSDNLLYFTERLADRIGRLDPLAGGDAAIQASLVEFLVPGVGSAPHGITTGPDGAVWFTEFGSGQIGKLTPAGVLTEFPAPESNGGPAAITTGPDGALWFTEVVARRIVRMTTSGVVTTEPFLPPDSDPEGITTGPDGNLWLTNFWTDKVARMTVGGELTEFSLGFGSAPLGITTGPDGALWSTLTGSGGIGRVTTAGLLATFLLPTTPAGQPTGIALGPDGALWFSEPGSDRIGRIFRLDLLLTGAGAGGGSHVRVLDTSSFSDRFSFFAYPAGFTGGVRVAVGDVNGDGVPDIITGAGPGGGPHVQVFSGVDLSLLHSFFAYDPAFTGGVFVGAGDVNGDGRADIITGPGAGGGPHVKVFSGTDLSLLRSFFAYDPSFTGGVFVAAGDVNGDGVADIVTGAGPGAGPHVQVFSGTDLSLLRSFFAYDPAFSGGVSVAAGDVNGDGVADIVTGAWAGGGPNVKVFNGADLALRHNFFAYDPAFTGGVFVAAGDVNDDGHADIVTGPGPGGGPHVKVFSGTDLTVLQSFFAYGPAFSGGVFVAR